MDNKESRPKPGVLIVTSIAIMTKLIDVGDKSKDDFIIKELDDHHLFVDESKI
jgi:hypothetical protein